MKTIIFLIPLLVLNFEISAQVLNGNSCTSDLQVTFLNVSGADKAFKNHDNLKEGVNLILTDQGVKYKGEFLSEIKALEDAIFHSENLPRSFDVVIGIRLNSPLNI